MRLFLFVRIQCIFFYNQFELCWNLAVKEWPSGGTSDMTKRCPIYSFGVVYISESFERNMRKGDFHKTINWSSCWIFQSIVTMYVLL